MSANRKKRVLYIITSSRWGGAQRYVYDLVTGLPRDEFEAAVALGGDGELARRLRAAEITVLSLTYLRRDLSAGHDANAYTAIVQVIRTYQPDIVHLNSSKAGGLGVLASRLLGVRRIVFTAHGWPFEEQRNIFWRTFAYFGSYVTALLSHVVIVVSRKDELLARHMPFVSSKVRLIHNGIAPETYGDGSVIRNAFPNGVRITGTIGELNRNKNHISLIEEARQDSSKHIAIVGEGELRAFLEEKIQAYRLTERVKLFGFLPAREVLRGFDEFALPSLKEGLPYVLIEARAAGLPIHARRVGGVPDILDSIDTNEFDLLNMIKATIALY